MLKAHDAPPKHQGVADHTVKISGGPNLPAGGPNLPARGPIFPPDVRIFPPEVRIITSSNSKLRRRLPEHPLASIFTPDTSNTLNRAPVSCWSSREHPKARQRHPEVTDHTVKIFGGLDLSAGGPNLPAGCPNLPAGGPIFPPEVRIIT